MVFKGVHYEMEVLCNGLYWIVQTTDVAHEGDRVGLKFGPDDIHIMHKLFDDVTNHLTGEVVEEDVIRFLGITFERPGLGLPVGSKVQLTVNPKEIELVSDDHSDIVLYLESLIYKGSYNEMLFYTEEDGYLLVHSENEEQVGTDLGLKFDFHKIQIKPLSKEARG